MLEYSKLILKKVSFDPTLFTKELRKSLDWIAAHEQKLLMQWCLMEFGNDYGKQILETFVQHQL
ncbi:MAG: hypothetical protein K2Q22_13585 [Cytophagales bacterium]|nr:hypothetical protein [Cytophagales bacterium]